MTIALKPKSFRIRAPGNLKTPQLPPHGGTVTVSFIASKSRPVKRIRATVGLTPKSYVLAGGKSEQEELFINDEVGINEDVPYDMELEIGHTDSEPVERIIVTLVLQEMHSNGKPNKKEKPLTAGADIKIRKLRQGERKALGKAIVKARKEAGHTQEDLQKKAGLSVSTISKVENAVPVSDQSLLTLLSKLKGN